ncbi:hypothetical protein JZ751_029540 [Albula glossodonta]|uniref:Uncharacterized protein n=1 Tax=Albula glossodonta TaxID=121402 RepID=A0A8T2NAA4_9TELE|nr:hypothetical protein JZ751_029540 [Albula glossodonta]
MSDNLSAVTKVLIGLRAVISVCLQERRLRRHLCCTVGALLRSRVCSSAVLWELCCAAGQF